MTRLPLGGVAQVIGHGVKVIGVEVGVHGEEGREKDEEVREEVKGDVEQLRDNRACAWREDGMTDSRTKKTNTACRRAQTYMLRMLVHVVSLLSLSTLVLMRLLSSCSFA